MDPHARQEDLQRLVDDMLDAAREAFFRTHQHKWQSLSPSWTALSGYDVDESLGGFVADLVHPDAPSSSPTSRRCIAATSSPRRRCGS